MTELISKETAQAIPAAATAAIAKYGAFLDKVAPEPFGPCTQMFLKTVAAQSPAIGEAARQLMRDHPALSLLFERFLPEMARYSPETADHSMRIASFTAAAAHSLMEQPIEGYPVTAEDGAKLCIASVLHDFGKLFVPLEILHHPGQILDQEDAQVMRNHVFYSAAMIDGMTMLPADLRSILHDMVLTHHEDLTGHGYPKGLTAGQIPPLMRVIPITDRFEALTANRSYRKQPFTTQEAVSMLQYEAKHGLIDPVLCRRLLPILEEKAKESVPHWAQRIAPLASGAGRSLP